MRCEVVGLCGRRVVWQNGRMVVETCMVVET
jgi:hypothetical protein